MAVHGWNPFGGRRVSHSREVDWKGETTQVSIDGRQIEVRANRRSNREQAFGPDWGPFGHLKADARFLGGLVAQAGGPVWYLYEESKLGSKFLAVIERLPDDQLPEGAHDLRRRISEAVRLNR
jgi:hypothetical protein